MNNIQLSNILEKSNKKNNIPFNLFYISNESKLIAGTDKLLYAPPIMCKSFYNIEYLDFYILLGNIHILLQSKHGCNINALIQEDIEFKYGIYIKSNAYINSLNDENKRIAVSIQNIKKIAKCLKLFYEKQSICDKKKILYALYLITKFKALFFIWFQNKQFIDSFCYLLEIFFDKKINFSFFNLNGQINFDYSKIKNINSLLSNELFKTNPFYAVINGSIWSMYNLHHNTRIIPNKNRLHFCFLYFNHSFHFIY